MKSWKKLLLYSVLIISAIAVTYMYSMSRKPKGIDVKSALVKRGDMSSYLSAGGIIQSRESKDYFVDAPSKVEKVYVQVGDKVKADELLVKIEVPDLSYQLKQAYIQLDIAETTVDNLKNKKTAAAEVESMAAKLPGANITMSAAQNIDDEIKLLEKQVEAARLNVSSIKDKINNALSGIKSDAAGIVTAINAVGGGMASPGIPVITVENTNSIKAILNVSQYDALKVKVGQEAKIKLGEDQREYKGVVERINPIAKKTIMGITSETCIPVEIGILNPDDDIKIGFDTDVDIITDIRKNVLYEPYEAIVKDKEGHVRVFVIQGDKVVLKDIEVGAESDFYAEIISGLLEGDNVILNPPSQLKDGSIVKIKNS